MLRKRVSHDEELRKKQEQEEEPAECGREERRPPKFFAIHNNVSAVAVGSVNLLLTSDLTL